MILYRNMVKRIAHAVLAGLLVGLLGNVVLCEDVELPRHMQSYPVASGTYDGISGTEYYIASTTRIQVAGAQWLRVHFSAAMLESSSYIIITSVSDGAWQRLDRVSITQGGT
jgi:hypothetical protein